MLNTPTLLYVEETSNALSVKVISNKTIRLVLLRFKQNMFFDEIHLKETSKIPCFVLDKEKSIENEVRRFKDFCNENNLVIEYFYNDSEYNQELVQEFASLLQLPGALDRSQALCVRDKVVMKDRLREIGFKVMAYQEILDLNDVYQFAERNAGFPIIVKWRKCLSSKEVYKVNSAKELEKLGLDYSTKRYIAEEYCPHLIWCIDSLVQDGKVAATFFSWLPYTNLSFAEKKEKFAQISVNSQPHEFRFDGREINQKVVSNLGLKNGYIHLEAFIDSSGQPIVCEFAWRTPGDHMLLNHSVAFGVDVYALLIDIMVGRKLDTLILVGKISVGDMFLPIIDGEIVEISSYEDLKKFEGVINGEVYYKAGDVVRSKRQYTSCSGWIQVVGETKDDVIKRMLKIYDEFKLVIKGGEKLLITFLLSAAFLQ